MSILTEPLLSGGVLLSAEFIIQNAEHVKISQSALEAFADTIDFRDVQHWIHAAPLDFSKLNGDETLMFVFLFNTMSFCYWGSGVQPDYFYIKDNQKHMTSWGLMAALYDGILAKKIPLNFLELSMIKDEILNAAINKDTTMPLFKERCETLRKCSKVINDSYDGDIRKLFLEGKRDACAVINLIYTQFPGYQDDALYKGEKVYFLKKAQIITADLYRLFKSTFANLDNPEVITACADYRLPQLLREMGVLEYDNELANIVDDLKDIPKGSAYEVEIRGSTIWANELIGRFLENKYKKKILPVDVNDYLWITAKKNAATSRPFHRTRTLMY